MLAGRGQVATLEVELLRWRPVVVAPAVLPFFCIAAWYTSILALQMAHFWLTVLPRRWLGCACACCDCGGGAVASTPCCGCA